MRTIDSWLVASACTRWAYRNVIIGRCCSSDIYFYRFINNDEPQVRTYSARFAIAKKIKTSGVMAATTQPATEVTAQTFPDGQVRTITYGNGTLKGSATESRTLPPAAVQTGRGNFSITLKSSSKNSTSAGKQGDAKETGQKDDGSDTESGQSYVYEDSLAGACPKVTSVRVLHLSFIALLVFVTCGLLL